MGTKAAKGHVCLFLHADCVLPGGWDVDVLRALRCEDVHATAFKFHASRGGLEGPSPIGLWLVEKMVRVRSSLLQLPFGDQAIAISTAQLLALGGLPEHPILEDYALMLKLMSSSGRNGRHVRVLDSQVSSAPRRFEEKGLWGTWLVNNAAMLAFLAGVQPASIFRVYYGRDV